MHLWDARQCILVVLPSESVTIDLTSETSCSWASVCSDGLRAARPRLSLLVIMLVYILLQVLLVFLKGFNFVLKGICGYSLYSGFVKDKTASKTEYDKCVHRCRIRFRAKPVENLVACRNNFLLSHISYESPSALLPDNVSLMGFTPTSALFAVVPENFDVYDSDHGKLWNFAALFLTSLCYYFGQASVTKGLLSFSN